MSVTQIGQKHSPKRRSPKKRKKQRVVEAEKSGEQRLAAIRNLLQQSPAKSQQRQKAKQGQAERIMAALDEFEKNSRALPSPNEIGVEAYSRRIKDLQDVKNAVIQKESPGIDLAKLIAEHTESTMAGPSKLIRKFHEERELIATLEAQERREIQEIQKLRRLPETYVRELEKTRMDMTKRFSRIASYGDRMAAR